MKFELPNASTWVFVVNCTSCLFRCCFGLQAHKIGRNLRSELELGCFAVATFEKNLFIVFNNLRHLIFVRCDTFDK